MAYGRTVAIDNSTRLIRNTPPPRIGRTILTRLISLALDALDALDALGALGALDALGALGALGALRIGRLDRLELTLNGWEWCACSDWDR